MTTRRVVSSVGAVQTRALLVEGYRRVGGQRERQELTIALAVPDPKVAVRHTPDERLTRWGHQGAGVAGRGQSLRARERRQRAAHGFPACRPRDNAQPVRVVVVAGREPKNARHFAGGSSSPRSERRYAADSSTLSSSPRAAWSRPSRTASTSSGCAVNTGALELSFGFVDGPDTMGTSLRRGAARGQGAPPGLSSAKEGRTAGPPVPVQTRAR